MGASVARVGKPTDCELHRRLLSRDPTAPADLALEHLDTLVRALRARFARLDEHLLETAAIDAVLELAERPEQYDPCRGSLATYLRMSARGNLLNTLRSERRRAARQAPIDDVEVAQRAGNSLGETPMDPAHEVLRAQAVPPDLLALVRSSFDTSEWQVVQLMLDGERRTSVYAAALGLTQLAELDRVRTVKRVKDRLQKRLQRLASRIERDV